MPDKVGREARKGSVERFARIDPYWRWQGRGFAANALIAGVYTRTAGKNATTMACVEGARSGA